MTAARKPRELTGQRFGKLVALRRDGSTVHNKARWLCRCDCGSEKTVIGANLLSGDSSSCGCFVPKHGRRFTVEYTAWVAMRQRCNNPNRFNHHHYSGRGIRVCEQWDHADGFEAFFAHIGPRPSSKHSVERIDNSKGYEPGNVRWATAKEQAQNRISSRRGTIDGVTRLYSEWADLAGISRALLSHRLKSGWSFRDAVFTPVDQRYSHGCKK